MDEGGVSITGITVGGAAIAAVSGIAGALIRARFGRMRVTPQPLDVRGVDVPTPRGQCDERHDEINSRTSNLFARVSSVEQRIAAVEASHLAQEKRLESMDGKLDRLLARKGS